jgi:glucose/arabinose dehydrogenase
MWSNTLTEEQIYNIALFVAEQRENFSYRDFNLNAELVVPTGIFETQLHDFRLETVAEDLDPLPYSIEPLPDGRLLLTEKMRGMRIIAADGTASPYITGTPPVYSDTAQNSLGSQFGVGWMLDVKLHPDYENNGWIYLSHGDRCEGCNAASREQGKPVSMVRLLRGRLRDGAWVDEEVLFAADRETYGTMPDINAGGRIAFDGQGHVFMSIGNKGMDNARGVQDLNHPAGKMLRLNEDGSIPEDNPFVDDEDAIAAIWTYGHRSPQGLEVDLTSGKLWGTEMGPRGGDEVNLLRGGRNYGWPLVSRGVNYDGSPVRYGEMLGIEFDPADIEQPVVDLTPSPAVASFIFYTGDAFPKWRNQMLVGSLKARRLYRMKVVGDDVTEVEVLIDGFARIKDVEQGINGEVYLLIEHDSGGKIVRLVPAGDA